MGIGFAGVKGFGGGFGQRVLAPWGEKTVKLFVHEAIDEALKLESALSRLRTERRFALLHYAPIAATDRLSKLRFSMTIRPRVAQPVRDPPEEPWHGSLRPATMRSTMPRLDAELTTLVATRRYVCVRAGTETRRLSTPFGAPN